MHCYVLLKEVREMRKAMDLHEYAGMMQSKLVRSPRNRTLLIVQIGCYVQRSIKISSVLR